MGNKIKKINDLLLEESNEEKARTYWEERGGTLPVTSSMKTILRMAKRENIQLFIDNNLEITEDIRIILINSEAHLLRLFIDNKLEINRGMSYILMWSKKENLEFFIDNGIKITRDKWYLLEEASLVELRKALREGEI